MVIAPHVIFGAYGFWLPNDPRGSWSEWVGACELFRYCGPATTVETRRSLAAEPHNRDVRLAAKQALKYPAIVFNDDQRAAVANGFRQFAEKSGLRILACAILREHMHLIVARHDYKIEQAVLLLKGAASRELAKQDLHPMEKFPRVKGRLPTCWARGEWKVFLNDVDDVGRAVVYAEANPEKEGLPPQQWDFVEPWREAIL